MVVSLSCCCFATAVCIQQRGALGPSGLDCGVVWGAQSFFTPLYVGWAVLLYSLVRGMRCMYVGNVYRVPDL